MNFCMNCGQRLVRRWVEADTRERSVCIACHTVHYENPKVIVGCFVYWRDRVVLCRRAIDPAKGKWDQPTGFMEAGETLEQAASRELLEEVGLEVPASSMVLYLVASIPHMNQVFVVFRAELPTEPTFNVGPDVLEARLFSEAELPLQDLAFREMIPDQYPRDFFRHLRDKAFPVVAITVAGPEPATDNAPS
jgi:ADP-ribose pyrophosphatase YjhB (NUDIX family)